MSHHAKKFEVDSVLIRETNSKEIENKLKTGS